MAATYNQLLRDAAGYKAQLDAATTDKDRIYYRGKYLATLKKAEKLNPSGIVPRSVNRRSTSTRIADEIAVELQNHRNQINTSIRNNKTTADKKNNTLAKEIGLKIRRIATSISSLKHARNDTERKNAKKNIAKDALGIGGTLLKSPVMIASRVLSTLGPLAIIITTLPITLLAAGLSLVIDIGEGQVKETNEYNNTGIHQMSKCLQDAVRSISNKIYQTTGRI